MAYNYPMLQTCLFPIHLAFISIMFRPSSRLLNACRLTLFVRPNCSLCDDAKAALSNVWDQRPFDYKEVNVMAPGQDSWKNVYEFDTPVVCSRALL